MSEGPNGVDLERAAQVAIEAALAAGAEEADAWCEDAVDRTVRVYGGSVESVTEAGSRGAGVRVFAGNRTGYAYGSDLSEQGLRDLAQAATDTAAVTDPDEHAGIQRDAGAADVGALASDDVDRWTMEQRVDLALAVERAARDRDPLVSNVEDTVYADSSGRVALANSAGFTGAFEQSQCYAYAYAFAGEGDDRMTGMGVGVGRGPETLDPEAIGHEAADRAVSLHGARQPASRRCPVVLDPYVAASFASVIGGTLSADAVQRGRSLFADKEGERIADERLRLSDDGIDPDGLATAPSRTAPPIAALRRKAPRESPETRSCASAIAPSLSSSPSVRSDMTGPSSPSLSRMPSVLGTCYADFRKPVFRSALRTSPSVFGVSVASAAGSLPAIARIQAAWRASTETIVAAAASASGVRFPAWPL